MGRSWDEVWDLRSRKLLGYLKKIVRVDCVTSWDLGQK